MRFTLDKIFEPLAGLRFADLSDVQTVGIGLYLALAVIQVVTESGVSGLRRRAETLREAVKGSKLRSEFAAMYGIAQEIERLDIGFRTFHRVLLGSTSALFIIALIYFTYCAIFSQLVAGVAGATFTFTYYLCLPLIIFGGSSLYVRSRCRVVAAEIAEAEKRYQQKVLG